MDLINRQDVIDAIYAQSDDDGMYAFTALELEQWIQALPSAEPERQTGHWVNNIHDLPICDQCGYMTPYDRAIDDYEYGNFCPNCGAFMGGETSGG